MVLMMVLLGRNYIIDDITGVSRTIGDAKMKKSQRRKEDWRQQRR